MKKRILIAAFMIVIACSGQIYAANNSITSVTSSQNMSSAKVKAKYDRKEHGGEVIKYDCSWGPMEFTYQVDRKSEWDEQTHRFVYSEANAWKENGNTVTVKNHSNKEIAVNAAYTADAKYQNDISGAFEYQCNANGSVVADGSGFHLKSAVGTSVEQAPEGTAILHISGSLPDSAKTLEKIGEIVIKVGQPY